MLVGRDIIDADTGGRECMSMFGGVLEQIFACRHLVPRDPPAVGVDVREQVHGVGVALLG